MDIRYLHGSKKEFEDFISLITSGDRVAVLSHNDLDGMSSAVFLEKILESRNIAINYLEFLEISTNMIKKLVLKLKEEGITKVFILDLGVDAIDFEGYNELRRVADVFLIDHHPIDKRVMGYENIIKTGSQDCVTMTLFDLGTTYFETGDWEWLNAATMFSEFSYKDEKNFYYMKFLYPKITLENLSNSVPGLNARKISSALIYYKKDLLHVYKLIKEKNVEELTEVHDIVEGEVNKLVNDFTENKKYYKGRKLYFYEVLSNFDVMSYFVSLVSKFSPNETFVFFQTRGEFVKVSARNSNGTVDVGKLMKESIEGMEFANGGGHKFAGAANIREQDVKEFKQRLLDSE